MRRISFALMAAALVLMLSACQGDELPPTPVLDVETIDTAAAQTVAAGQATEVPLALATPTGMLFPLPGTTSAIPNTGATALAGGTTAQGCDNLTYVSDVTVPDGTVMLPGQQFVKTWAVDNTGSCPWTTDYQLVLVKGDPMGGTTAPLTAQVAAGTTADLSVGLTAPAAPGNYTSSWRLRNAAGVYFGDVITVVITVATGGKGSAGGSIAQGSRNLPA
jgi:hypothetical protein